MQSHPYERSVLSNGVRLILVPMKGVESVATAVMVGVGSRYETPAINGVNHFIEHMVFKGTKKYPTTEDVNVIERVGGLQNAYTDVDVTSYHNKALVGDWELALEINKELALNPLLEQKYIDQERNVILEEMKRYEDEPAAKAEETFHKMMYPGTRLGMRTIGEEESLRAVASRELREYHDDWYQSSRLVVILAGKLKAQSSKLKALVEDWFGQLTRDRADDFIRVKDQQSRPQLAVVTKPGAQQAHLILGLRTFARGSDDRFAWNIFNLIMGVGFTSRLFKEIREKRGLCYHIRSESSTFAEVGYWSIYAGVGTERVEEAVKAIQAELARAKDGGVREDEITVGKKRIKTMLAFKSEDPEFFSEWYGRQEVYGMPVMTVDDYIKRIESITKDDITRLIQKYFQTRTLNLALVWNKPRDEALNQLLHL